MEKLIDGCVKGKQKARKELFRRYHKMLLGICMRYSRDKSEAEDILLEGFIQIYSITPNYGIYLKPFYKHGMNSLYINYPLSVKYNSLGVKFGINIYF